MSESLPAPPRSGETTKDASSHQGPFCGHVLLLVGHRSYRVRACCAAIRASGRDIVVFTDRPSAIAGLARGLVNTVDPRHEEQALAAIVDHVRALEYERGVRVDALLAPDDDLAVLGARVAKALGLVHHPVDAVRIAGDKLATRRACADRGVNGPWFSALPSDPSELARVAASFTYPCVVKPTRLAAGVGVMRADDARSLIAAGEEARTICARLHPDAPAAALMVEGYLPGAEVIVEAVLCHGRFHALAVLDKPDAGHGPLFDETLLITPSRLPRADIHAAIAEAERACAAVGLRHGPVHAELRVSEGRATLIEVAARSIGGYCSEVVALASWPDLESLLLALALGRRIEARELAVAAGSRGVMMIPVAESGVLERVAGVEEARAVPGIEAVSVLASAGSRVAPAPVSGRYLGFIHAAADTPAEVERALRRAHARLRVDIAAPSKL